MRLLINKLRLYKNVVKTVVIISIFLILGICFADSITLTTYYPAPFGNYQRIDTVEMRFSNTTSWTNTANLPEIVNSTGSNPGFYITGKMFGTYTEDTVEVKNGLVTTGDLTVGDVATVNTRVGVGISPSYRIHVVGGAYCTGTSWINASDIAYKANIKDLKYGLNEILKLQPKEFDFKQDGSHQVGLVAQEVEKIIPEVVSGKEGEKGLSYGNLVAVLVKAIQQQQAQIESLKVEIEELKTNNQLLKQ